MPLSSDELASSFAITILGIDTPTAANEECSTGIAFISAEPRQVIQQQYPPNKGSRAELVPKTVGMTFELRSIAYFGIFLLNIL